MYPFSKGRYRLMKLAEKYLDKQDDVHLNLFGRYRFLLDLRRGDLESSFYYFLPELYEPETQRYICDHIRPGMTVLDIGAHVGFFSLLLADRVQASGKVYSFEPETINFERLRLNLESNKLSWVSPFQMAMSDELGTQKLLYHRNTSGNFLANTANFIRIKRDTHGSQEVGVTTLDEFTENQNLRRVDLIKMDAEGSEIHILRGGQKMLSSGIVHRIICEVQSSVPDKEDPVRGLFYAYGYRSYILNTNLSKRKYLSELKPAEPVTGLQNLVFERGYRKSARSSI